MYTIAMPNEWGCPVYINRSEIPATAAVPRLAGHPECGVTSPAVPAHTQMSFLWPAHGQTGTTIQHLRVSPDCKFMCFPPKFSAVGQGPYARKKGPPPPGICSSSYSYSSSSSSSSSVARPWLNSTFSGLRVKGAQGTEACPLSTGHGLCAFLVSSSISAQGVVGTVRVLSEGGGNFTFLSPWTEATTPTTATCDTGPGCSSGGQVPVTVWPPQGLFHLEAHERVLAFETQSGTSYSLRSGSDT